MSKLKKPRKKKTPQKKSKLIGDGSRAFTIPSEWSLLCESLLEDATEEIESVYSFTQLTQDPHILLDNAADRLLKHIRLTDAFPGFDLDAARTMICGHMMQRLGQHATEELVNAVIFDMDPEVPHKPEPWPSEGLVSE
ncbi:hypothetical protein [Candidatus Pantoea multigeneris]|uniref:Uncharacterized protein n=1 Tax=Candidatus Pantoea multigeneris TaxID=2608357 RepID=A0ABX0RGN5_9GAMM|nr:hypothetical protein [Pantoea multigeneris]NIF23959.1 hypothetical protein [Pantoea multigeneris]